MRPPVDKSNPEPAGSVRGGYGIGARLLSYLSATWCGSVLVVLEVLWIGFFVRLVPTFYPAHTFPGFAGALIVLCVGAVCDFVLGVAFGRFLLRAMPPQPLDRTKGRHPIIIAIFVCALLIGILLWCLNSAEGLFSWSYEWEQLVEDAAIAVGRLFVILWAIGAVGPLILRHVRPRAFLHRPFVLFLRRFSTFSDRTLVALILKEAKDGVPVVFLTPARSRFKDWNPFLVGFAGLKLRHPLRSVPIVLRARDDGWQRVADELILRAQTILVDASWGSAALEAEAEMIEKAERWSDTVHLRYTARTPGSDREAVGIFENARCIEYSKSWMRALPRLAVSLVIILLVAPLPSLFIFYFWKVGVLPHGLVFFILVLISCSIVWSQAVSPNAKIKLRRVLRAEDNLETNDRFQ